MQRLLERLRRRARSGADRDSRSSAIPERLHFIWGLFGASDPIPPQLARFVDAWRHLNASWEVTVHDAEEVKRVAEQYPMLPLDRYQHDIQKCDAVRPMLLHRYGGVYSDMDVQPHRALHRLFARYPGARVLLAVETTLSPNQAKDVARRQPIRNGVPECRRRIANYFMVSAAGHPFWLDVLERMNQRRHLAVRSDYDILYTTGPDIVSQVTHDVASRYPDVVVVPQNVIRRVITHHCNGGWRKIPLK